MPPDRNQSIFAIFGVVAFVGCATEPPPRPVALDPSNPAAAESPRPPPTSLAPSGTPATKAPEPVPGKGAKQEPTIYTCPMHPEVTSDKPGHCPKCGMELVPKGKNK